MDNEPNQVEKTIPLSWTIGVDELGQKTFEVNCPICQELFICIKRKDNFFRHLVDVHNLDTKSSTVQPDWMIERDRQRNREVSGKLKQKTEQTNTSPVPKRCFYVDTAKSIKSKEGIRYWKGVLVEDGKCLAEFANSKVQWANGAETYAILKSIYWLIENKVFETEPLRVHIHSDSMIAVRSLNQPNKSLNHWEKKYPHRNDDIKSHFYKYLYCIRKLLSDHNLKHRIKFIWVKGDKNPADYYSRDAYKWWNPSKQGKLLVKEIESENSPK